MVTSVTVVSAVATSSIVELPRMPDIAMRRSSRRRRARTDLMASSIATWRFWIARASSCSATPDRGRSIAGSSSHAADSGIHSMSSPT